MNDQLIDVWDLDTFDPELIAILAAEADTIRSYMIRDHEIFLAHDLGRGPGRSILRPDNAHAGTFMALKDRLGAEMQARTIRAWHYTRLTDEEADALRTIGVEISTVASLSARLAARVAAGDFSQAVADDLYAASPFHGDQLGGRKDKFWMTSHPVVVDDTGVAPLMARWGGEVASFWLKDPSHCATLAAIGRRCVVELAVPLALTNHAHSAGEGVIATLGRGLGCIPSKQPLDLYVGGALPRAAILALHTRAGGAVYAVGGMHSPNLLG